MNLTLVSELIRHALMTAFWLSLPLLAIGFVIGVLISLVQIVTSIQDASFASVPRLATFLLAFIALLPWMLQRWIEYAAGVIGNVGAYAR